MGWLSRGVNSTITGSDTFLGWRLTPQKGLWVDERESAPVEVVAIVEVDPPATMSVNDVEDLGRAVELLENPSFVARVTDAIGEPLEAMIDFLPARASGRLQGVVRTALVKLLDVSVRTLENGGSGHAAPMKHRLVAGISGAVSGFFGVAALAVELPITTSIILRSIAEIARSEGEDISSLDARLACLEVFALGGASSSDDASETGYFAVRAALAKAMADAAKHIAERGLVQEGAPVIARMVAALASRFGTVVSEKVAAQAVPVLGAAGGATINVLFMSHFQDVARGHFTVRRLERQYGREVVRSEYARIAAGQR